MFNEESKRIKVEMVAHGRLDARKEILVNNEAKPEPSANEKDQLEDFSIWSDLKALLPMFLMVLVIGLVSVSSRRFPAHTLICEGRFSISSHSARSRRYAQITRLDRVSRECIFDRIWHDISHPR
jgi:hypothetical protein